jgi:hypothetical protein
MATKRTTVRKGFTQVAFSVVQQATGETAMRPHAVAAARLKSTRRIGNRGGDHKLKVVSLEYARGDVTKNTVEGSFSIPEARPDWHVPQASPKRTSSAIDNVGILLRGTKREDVERGQGRRIRLRWNGRVKNGFTTPTVLLLRCSRASAASDR